MLKNPEDSSVYFGVFSLQNRPALAALGYKEGLRILQEGAGELEYQGPSLEVLFVVCIALWHGIFPKDYDQVVVMLGQTGLWICSFLCVWMLSAKGLL